MERVGLMGAAMYPSEAVDEIREKLVKYRLAPRKFLSRTILKQIAKQDCFDGAYAGEIQEMIKSMLRPLDDATIISLWRETVVGMCKKKKPIHRRPPL
jgi:hypothetical protein